jgi:hypothetical protein
MSGKQLPWDWQELQSHFSLGLDQRRAKIDSDPPIRPAKVVPKTPRWHSGRPPAVPRRNSVRIGTDGPPGYPGHYGEMQLGEYSQPGYPEHHDVNTNFFTSGSGTPKKAKQVAQPQSQPQPQRELQAYAQPNKTEVSKKDGSCDCCVVM